MHLVGGIVTSLKNMKVNWDYDSQLNGKIKICFQTNQSFNEHAFLPGTG